MQHGFRAPRAPTMTHQQAHSQQQQILIPQQKTLSKGPAQWTGPAAVPSGFSVHQHGGLDQQPPQQMPTNEAHSQHRTTQEHAAVARQMPPQQQNLTSNDHGYRMRDNVTPNRVALLSGHAGQQQQMPNSGMHFVASNQVGFDQSS